MAFSELTGWQAKIWEYLNAVVLVVALTSQVEKHCKNSASHQASALSVVIWTRPSTFICILSFLKASQSAIYLSAQYPPCSISALNLDHTSCKASTCEGVCAAVGERLNLITGLAHSVFRKNNKGVFCLLILVAHLSIC